MAINRGKQFEDVVKNCLEKVQGVDVTRLHDQTNGYLGSRNPCDFIVYKYPYQYDIECKSVHENTFPFSNITDYQYYGLLKKAKIEGVVAGILVWWVDKDVTKFIPIEIIEILKNQGEKSIRWDAYIHPEIISIEGVKKRVFFEYDFSKFFEEVENGLRRVR